MQIETFEVISLDEQHGDVMNELVSEEALAIIDKLDLSGQKGLLDEREADGERVTTRVPYREVTAEELAVFGAVLPRKVRLEVYRDGPIPLRVLQVAAHAKGFFESLEVWCPQNEHERDPLLIGIKGRYSQETRFILARWGEILEPLETLRQKARPIVLARAKQQLAEAKSAVAEFEATLDASIDAFLLGGEPKSVWLHTLSLAQ